MTSRDKMRRWRSREREFKLTCSLEGHIVDTVSGVFEVKSSWSLVESALRRSLGKPTQTVLQDLAHKKSGAASKGKLNMKALNRSARARRRGYLKWKLVHRPNAPSLKEDRGEPCTRV